MLCSAVCSSLMYVSGISCKLQQKTEIKDKITHAQLSFMLKHLRYRVISIHVQFYQDPVGTIDTEMGNMIAKAKY